MTDRSLTGRRSRASGEMFERWIDSACAYYRELGIAHIQKTPEPVRILKPYGERRTGQFVACFKKQAQPDFKGCLCDGTAIMFDAKHTDSDRINQTVVTEEQTSDLNEFEKMGAHVYILVGIGMENFYRVPWDVWKNMKELFGHKHMDRTDLEPYRLKEAGTTILFLEGIELEDTAE
ncbi:MULTISPECIES: Holliday junction resolvase RecU [unclassified Bilifractor]|uniref:Holliday junction resolvase RecU n=1 Tax=unclassified Bilifractor TaxID=2815795 RepID=UPI003F8EE480